MCVRVSFVSLTYPSIVNMKFVILAVYFDKNYWKICFSVRKKIWFTDFNRTKSNPYVRDISRVCGALMIIMMIAGEMMVGIEHVLFRLIVWVLCYSVSSRVGNCFVAQILCVYSIKGIHHRRTRQWKRWWYGVVFNIYIRRS